MRILLKVWRQAAPTARGEFKDYVAEDVSPDMSFLEMLDVVNEGLISKGEDPIAFDSDCREVRSGRVEQHLLFDALGCPLGRGNRFGPALNRLAGAVQYRVIEVQIEARLDNQNGRHAVSPVLSLAKS